MNSISFREVSPDAAELAPFLNGLFTFYASRYGDYFNASQEDEQTAWYLPPHGLFLVMERQGEIIGMGAFKPFDEETAELKRIWTRSDLRRQGLALQMVTELERRARQAGYQHLYLTTGFRQPEAVQLYLGCGYQPQFDIEGDLERYSQPPYDGRLRFRKAIGQQDVAQAS